MSSLILNKIVELVDTAPRLLTVPVITSLVLVFMSWLYVKIARGKYNIKLLNRIPGPTPLPFLGNALEIAVPHEQVLQAIDRITSKHGPIVKFFLAHRPYVVLTRAQGFETVLSNNKFNTKGPDYKFLRPWLGLGLLTSDGQKWFHRRKMLTPSFHFKILEDFLVIMNEHSNVLCDKLAKLDPKTEKDLFPYITLAALDIICESAMGKHVNAQMMENSAYVNAIFKASDIIFHRTTSPWYWSSSLFFFSPMGRELKRCLKVLHDYTDNVIQERKAEFRSTKKEKKETKPKSEDDIIGKKKRLAFLDMLLQASEDNDKLTDQDLREEVDTFMFEGHDTTAANMAHSLSLLAAHVDVQKKVQKELDEIFGTDTERPITPDDLAKMRFLESCLKESLRLFPSVPIMTRTIYEDAVIEGKEVPANTNILMVPYLLHRDPEQFPEPNKFDPSRFSAENTRQRHAYAYVPFSAGPRNCIGQKFAMMEEKVIVASILRRFDLSTDVVPEKALLLPDLILRPKDGVPIRVKPRKQSA